MIERLPTPWGLVRLGVAPDHPKLKSVSRAFERIADQPGFRFLGNVEVGRDLHHDDLVRLYDAVIYAVGAQTDRRLGIPGEDLPGSWPATEFVAWYNGHPDFQQLEFDLDVERAVVIGNGNVALDVARMLALTHEELAPTDTTDAAIEAIASSPIREIVVVGRRGPAQAAFTTPELHEMGELAGADVVVDPADLEGAEPQGTNAERNLAVLQRVRGARAARASRAGSSSASSTRRWRSSARSGSRESSSSATSSTRTTRAVADGRARDARVRARLPQRRLPRRRAPRRRRSTRSSGTIPNEGGRVEPGVYVAGWIKRGPTGVIGTNKKDATETVELLLEDAAAGRLAAEAGRDRRRRRRAARRARRPRRRVRGLDGDRRDRAGGGREARPAAREALLLGRAARAAASRASPPIGGHRAYPQAPMDLAWTPSSSNASTAARAACARRDRVQALRVAGVPRVRLPRLDPRARGDRGRAPRAARAPARRAPAPFGRVVPAPAPACTSLHSP